ncbi:MAG: hypothetical protein JO147_08165 [Actinobacteria bacterium]|nr:hypothetical protein [Actinomycetota bacterium]
MFTMHEALARVRMPEPAPSEQAARQERVMRHMMAARRWHRVERLAQRAGARHERALESAE